MFIVIDGIDGSGKWTQTELLEKNLKKLWKKVKILDYPRYSEDASFFVKKYLNGSYWKNVTAKQASLFYALDRFDDSFNLKKSLKKYDYIISNRYVSANMIHQAGKIKDKKEKKEFLEWLVDLEFNILKIPKPDKIIFLNVSHNMSQKLVLKKAERAYLKWWKKMDIHEEDLDHLKNAHNSALEVAKEYNWTQIICEKDWNMRSIEDIQNEILENIL